MAGTTTGILLCLAFLVGCSDDSTSYVFYESP